MLMEEFDAWHLLSRFRDFQPIPNDDESSIDFEDTCKEAQYGLHPEAREPVDIKRRAMEEIEDPVVAGVFQPKGTHDAGDAPEIGSDRQTGKADG